VMRRCDVGGGKRTGPRLQNLTNNTSDSAHLLTKCFELRAQNITQQRGGCSGANMDLTQILSAQRDLSLAQPLYKMPPTFELHERFQHSWRPSSVLRLDGVGLTKPFRRKKVFLCHSVESRHFAITMVNASSFGFSNLQKW
jgi:hypothetical protein